MVGIELRRASGPPDDLVGTVFEPGTRYGSGDEHLFAQMDDLAALCRDERIDAGEQVPGTWDVRVFQPCHHVQLALEKTEVTGEPPHPLLAPALRLPLLVKVVRRKEQPIQNIYGIAEVGVLFVGPARRQRRPL